MISKKLDKFFSKYLWMIEHEEYRMFQNALGKVVPTRVTNGSISDSEYAKRCSEFLDTAEKLLDKETLAEMATMFKTADIDLESDQLNSRWKNYLTLSEAFQYSNEQYDADAFDKEIIQSRTPIEPELTDKLDNRSGKEYTGLDAVYMIVGQVKIPASSRPADTYYYSTLKNNWVKDVHEGTQYDSKSDAEEDLWDAENLFIDDHSGETRFGRKYQLAVKVVGRKPRKGNHKGLHMNIYEQLNKINDAESLSEKYNVKNVKELKKLQEDQVSNNNILTSEQLLSILKELKREKFGSLVIKNDSVRFTSYEDDLSKYVTLDNLLHNINNDSDVTSEEILSDPSLVLDYFDEEIFAHSYFDVPDYRADKLKLNQKYFGALGKSAFDGSWMKYGVEFKNLDHPSWVYKITSPDPKAPVNYEIKTPIDYVWYNKATPATKMQFLPAHNTACRASVFDKLMRQGKIQLL